MTAQPTSWVLNFGSVVGDQATAITEDQTGDIITVGIIDDSVNFSWRGTNYISVSYTHLTLPTIYSV